MNNNIDWADVENKIALICYKFDNLSAWHEDLAQELRIHAYYYSDNYYDLYRKAIDFWRKVQAKQSPEIPYFDLEVLGKSYEETSQNDQFEEIVSLVRKELNRPGYTKWDSNLLEIASKLFDIITEDIDPRLTKSFDTKKSKLNPYINKRLNISWAAEETGFSYKRLASAMKLIEDIVRGLAAMKKIEIPEEYFKGYYEE